MTVFIVLLQISAEEKCKYQEQLGAVSNIAAGSVETIEYFKVNLVHNSII